MRQDIYERHTRCAGRNWVEKETLAADQPDTGVLIRIIKISLLMIHSSWGLNGSIYSNVVCYC